MVKAFTRTAAGVVLLLVAVAGAARALEPLDVDSDTAIAAAAGTGLLTADDFEAVADPHVGPLLVGRPGGPDPLAVSVVLFEGESGLEQIQVVLQKPWGDLSDKLRLAGALLELVVAPDAIPEPNAVIVGSPEFAGLDRGAQWLLGLFSESWAGWPGSETRQVRELDGIAVIAEGTPPEFWMLTLVVDEGYGDANWPGEPEDSEAVSRAREALRAGDYRTAHDLLRADGIPDDPVALALLGDLQRFGRLGRADQQTAADYYLRASRTKYPGAVWPLAVMSNTGYGVLTLDGLRFPLLETAAEGGHADALFTLSAQQEGVFYQRPEGVTPLDQVTAAARLGLLAAQVDLANRYAAGDGVEADPVAAYAWALVAVGNTDPGIDWIRSRELAARYKQDLTGKQIADAHEMAERFEVEIGG